MNGDTSFLKQHYNLRLIKSYMKEDKINMSGLKNMRDVLHALKKKYPNVPFELVKIKIDRT